MLRTRIITASILLPLLVAGLFFLPGRGWEALMGLVVLLAAWEWAAFARLSSWRKPAYAAVTVLLAIVLAGLGAGRGEPSWLLNGVLIVAGVFWLLIAPQWLRFMPQTPPPLSLATVGWIVLVPAWLGAVLLRSASPWLLLGVMVTIWIADTAAYFTGRAIGKRKLAPSISPGKTWEGVAGAFCATTLYVLVLVALLPGLRERADGPQVLALVLIIWLLTAVSIVGDLFESLMKRQVNLKDSGTILPGHGGILDRIDALTSTLPLAALIHLNFLLF